MEFVLRLPKLVGCLRLQLLLRVESDHNSQNLQKMKTSSSIITPYASVLSQFSACTPSQVPQPMSHVEIEQKVAFCNCNNENSTDIIAEMKYAKECQNISNVQREKTLPLKKRRRIICNVTNSLLQSLAKETTNITYTSKDENIPTRSQRLFNVNNESQELLPPFSEQNFAPFVNSSRQATSQNEEEKTMSFLSSENRASNSTEVATSQVQFCTLTTTRQNQLFENAQKTQIMPPQSHSSIIFLLFPSQSLTFGSPLFRLLLTMKFLFATAQKFDRNTAPLIIQHFNSPHDDREAYKKVFEIY